MRRQQFSWSGFHDHGQVVMKSLAPTLYSAVATQGVNGSVQKHSTTKAMEQLVLSLARKWASPQQLGQILLSSDGRVVVKLRDGKIISSLQNLLWGNAHVGETAFSIPSWQWYVSTRETWYASQQCEPYVENTFIDV